MVYDFRHLDTIYDYRYLDVTFIYHRAIYDYRCLGVTFVYHRGDTTFVCIRTIQNNKIYSINDKNQINSHQYSVKLEFYIF